MSTDRQPPFRLPPETEPSLASRGTELVNSWKFPLPFGAVCIALLLARAWSLL